MKEMTEASTRDSAGVLSFCSVRTQMLILCTPKLYVFRPLGLGPSLIFWDVDETNCLSIDGVSTSYIRFGMSSFLQVIFTFHY